MERNVEKKHGAFSPYKSPAIAEISKELNFECKQNGLMAENNSVAIKEI